MRKTRRAVLGAAVLAAAAFAAAQTVQLPPPGERGAWTRPGHLARVLALTDQQQEAVRKVMEERRADHEVLREKLESNREAMQQALQDASPDPTAVGELAIEAHRLRQQARALRDAQEKAIRELLTAEQRVKLDAVEALRSERMGGPPDDVAGPGPERPGRP